MGEILGINILDYRENIYERKISNTKTIFYYIILLRYNLFVIFLNVEIGCNDL